MKMNKFVKQFEDVIYTKETKMLESGLEIRTYLPIEEKYGLVNILFNLLYDGENNVFDYVNAEIFVPAFVFERYAENVDLEDEDSDITGFYDYLKLSDSIKYLESEIEDVKKLLEAKVKMVYRQKDSENPLFDLLKDYESKSPEEISAMQEKIKELSNDDSLQKILNFKERADK